MRSTATLYGDWPEKSATKNCTANSTANGEFPMRNSSKVVLMHREAAVNPVAKIKARCPAATVNEEQNSGMKSRRGTGGPTNDTGET